MNYTNDVAEFSFFKKFSLPKLSWGLSGKPKSVIGLDIGIHSSKVVELEYIQGKASLKTYGELLSSAYLKAKEGAGGGFLRFIDTDVVGLIKDLLKETEVKSNHAVVALPASASFTTSFPLPRVTRAEIEQAIPFEARKYIPVPITEVILDWEIIEKPEDAKTVEIILVAVPREVIGKFKHIAELAGIVPLALEVENFSLIRALAANEKVPVAIINMGFQDSTLTIADQTRLLAAHRLSKGSEDLTRALERGLAISRERADAIKKEVGLSERIEEREIASVLAPFIDTFFSEIERFIYIHNRKASRKIQKIILTGGGSNLKGIIEFAASKFGVEIVRGNPFANIATPPMLEPVLKDIGPSFSVAAGLALRNIE